MANPENLFGVELGAIRDRLAALSYFTAVDTIQGGAEALGGLKPFLPPAAFVSIASETYRPNRYAAGGHGQTATVAISVLFCIPAERADRETNDAVEAARKAIAGVLVGWAPPGAGKALDADRYQVRLIADGLIWGEWLFRTSFNFAAFAAAEVVAGP